ncbi:hypothetical protein HPULCUR_005367 [Helicostylum pulchrum]|uniref:Uncharacterized protein n=1 Tax=Helicostylum pulchrum TaxID=562976 RepID=A0ABP9XZ01_9FUNG
MVGEVKGEDQKDDKYICLLDLVRIGCISVDTVNLNLYDGVIGIHVVALQATFFFTTLVADGFYVMLEICTIPLPRDVTELRSYITYFDDLLTVIQYSSKCEVCSDKKTLESMTARKISTPEFDRVITSSRNRRRECPIVYHH